MESGEEKPRISFHRDYTTLADGMSDEDILRDFPELELEDIRACLAFSAE